MEHQCSQEHTLAVFDVQPSSIIYDNIYAESEFKSSIAISNTQHTWRWVALGGRTKLTNRSVWVEQFIGTNYKLYGLNMKTS